MKNNIFEPVLTVTGGEVVVGIEGLNRKFDDGGVTGSGDVDASSGENGSFVVVDLDIQQAGGYHYLKD